jgi:protein-disulfide isomerase
MTMKARTLLCLMALGSAMLGTMPAKALDDAQKEEIGAFIREYLLENPEIMIEVQQALEQKQQSEQQARAGETIANAQDAIFNAPTDIALGNPDGDVTVVEFFDYNCGFCKRAHADMQAILASDGDVRFVLKEFPILGPDSLAAHRVSMAVRKVAPESYGEFQDALMQAERATEEVALAIASEMDIAEDRLVVEMNDPAIENEIRDTYQLADALGITGTPSYVVGDEAVFGALGAEVLSEKIANVRECDSATC